MMCLIKSQGIAACYAKLLIYSSQASIILCILVFIAFCIPYTYTPTTSEVNSKTLYSTPNLIATEVVCAFPVSGQYGRTPQFTYIVMLAITVIIRRSTWLAVGIAAYALSYSGAAALHQIMIFMHNNRFSPISSHAYCEFLSIGPESPMFPACAGLYEPDFARTNTIIEIGLLAALPIAFYSTTFQKAESRPILIMWTLLLAIAYSFYTIIITDPNRHYQICPIGYSETLPGNAYNAMDYNDSWRQALEAISLGTTNMSTGCIYSCFRDYYLGRNPNEIGIYSVKITDARSLSLRKYSIMFGMSYILLMIFMFVVKHKKEANEKQQLRQDCCRLTRNNFFSWLNHKNWYCYAQWCIQGLCLVFYITKIQAVIAQEEVIPCLEKFSSVGQWSVVATVGLTLSATLLNRACKRWNLRRRPKQQDLADEELSLDTWGCEVGYAS